MPHFRSKLCAALFFFFFFSKRRIDIKDEQEQERFEGLTVKVFPGKVQTVLLFLIYHQNTEKRYIEQQGKNTKLIHKFQDVTSNTELKSTVYTTGSDKQKYML